MTFSRVVLVLGHQHCRSTLGEDLDVDVIDVDAIDEFDEVALGRAGGDGRGFLLLAIEMGAVSGLSR